MKKLMLSLLLLAIMSNSSQAAIQNSSDFEKGSTLGIGLVGVSYDYAFEAFSFGGFVVNPSNSPEDSLRKIFDSNLRSQPFKFGTRMSWRFMKRDGLSLGTFAALTLDPGQPGDKLQFTPDLGISLAYRFSILDIPMAARLNMSLAFDSSTRNNSSGDVITTNFFQRLNMGPGTGLELAIMPLDYLEITIGGGTLFGSRLKF